MSHAAVNDEGHLDASWCRRLRRDIGKPPRLRMLRREWAVDPLPGEHRRGPHQQGETRAVAVEKQGV
jgi:hypothetical protein